MEISTRLWNNKLPSGRPGEGPPEEVSMPNHILEEGILSSIVSRL